MIGTEEGYAAVLRSDSLDNKTTPETNPTNAGKKNTPLQLWKSPPLSMKRREMTLAIQQVRPLGLVSATGNLHLSTKEPPMASTVPRNNMKTPPGNRIGYAQAGIFLQLCHSSRADRNTPAMVRITPAGKTQLKALVFVSAPSLPLHSQASCALPALAKPLIYLGRSLPLARFSGFRKLFDRIERNKSAFQPSFEVGGIRSYTL